MNTVEGEEHAFHGSASVSKAGTRSILLVDDNPWVREAVAASLKELLQDVTVTATGRGRDASDIVTTRPLDKLITEVSLPGMDGYELIGQARKQRPDMPKVVRANDCSVKAVEHLTSLGANRLIEKPYDGKTITSAVRAELDRIAGTCDWQAAAGSSGRDHVGPGKGAT